MPLKNYNIVNIWKVKYNKNSILNENEIQVLNFKFWGKNSQILFL